MSASAHGFEPGNISVNQTLLTKMTAKARATCYSAALTYTSNHFNANHWNSL